MGDPLAAYVTERTTDEQYEMLAEKHGINEPIYVQYFTYLKSVITFDWGYSEVLNEDVSDALRYRFAATLELSILAFIFDSYIIKDMTVWPSGLRRWLQAPVRKGVGSNPTAVKETCAESTTHMRDT